jgi:hypothetical protein
MCPRATCPESAAYPIPVAYKLFDIEHAGQPRACCKLVLDVELPSIAFLHHIRGGAQLVRGRRLHADASTA